MKKKIFALLVAGATVNVFALDLLDMPNEGAYPAAKALINSNNVLLEAESANQIARTAATSNAFVGITNATLTVLNGTGTTNTLIFTNGTLRIVQ